MTFEIVSSAGDRAETEDADAVPVAVRTLCDEASPDAIGHGRCAVYADGRFVGNFDRKGERR
jgi:hypothetical protein